MMHLINKAIEFVLFIFQTLLLFRLFALDNEVDDEHEESLDQGQYGNRQFNIAIRHPLVFVYEVLSINE